MAETGVEHESTEPGQGFVNVFVHPEHRAEGAGGLLVGAAEQRLTVAGATAVYSWVLDRPADRAFAGRRGYRPLRSAHFLSRDLANPPLPPRQEPPPGVELYTGADFADDPRPLFELDAETTLDEPGDIDTRFADYELWLTTTWRHPLLHHGLTSVAVLDGRPVAFSAARTDGGTRYGTVMTGTARAHRGRGLARLLKTDSLHRARAAGFTEAVTGNDAGNGPMLAVNNRLGYEIRATEVRHVRPLV